MIILTSIKRLRGEKPNRRKPTTKPNYREFEVFLDKIVSYAIQSLNHFRTNDHLEDLGFGRYRYSTKFQYVYTAFNKKPGEKIHSLTYRNLFAALYESLEGYETEYKFLEYDKDDSFSDARYSSGNRLEEIVKTIETIYKDLRDKELIDPIFLLNKRFGLKNICYNILKKYGFYNIGIVKHEDLTMDIIFYCKYDDLKEVWEK